MACECISLVDDLLKPQNTRLSLAFVVEDSHQPGLMIKTEQIETGRGKAKATVMFPSFCPFCGQRYAAPVVDAAMKKDAHHG